MGKKDPMVRYTKLHRQRARRRAALRLWWLWLLLAIVAVWLVA